MQTEERVFLDKGDIKVTNSRFIVPAQTYAMSGITSVKTVYTQPFKGPAILALIGGLITVANFSNGSYGPSLIGIFIIVSSIAWFIKNKKFILVLSSASGETEALSSKDARLVNQIVNAINEAIISRG